MLRRRRVERAADEPVPTTLAHDTHLKGTLRFDSTLRIDGRFDGEIRSDGRLLIGESATVHASIDVGSAVIGGTVRGDVKAADSIELLATARVFGDVGTARLIVADGAVFEGELDMGAARDRNAPAAAVPDAAVPQAAVPQGAAGPSLTPRRASE